MQIFIPTLGRPNIQETWKNLPESIKDRTNLLVSEREFFDYRAFPRIALPEECAGIGRVRQWVIDNSPGKVVMLDDDLRFAKRRDDDPTRFQDASVSDIEAMFIDLEHALNSYAHASVCTREGGNRNTEVFTWNGRLLRVLAYRADVLRSEGVKFNRTPVMEDFDVTLQLLRLGYPNISINWVVQDQRGSNLAGGCSIYRSDEVQKVAAESLKILHPEFVTVVTKQTKTAWQGKKRTDVRIQWKQAFESYRGPERTLPVLDYRAGESAAREDQGSTEAVVERCDLPADVLLQRPPGG